MHTDEILALVRHVAATSVTPRFNALETHEVDHKSGLAAPPVTVADREAEVLLTAALHDAYPGALVLGEEAYAADPTLLHRFRTAGHAFTVDPVDGTRQFVKGSPDHAVMVAEVRGGQVVRSWIHQPQHARSYVAERGAGAWRVDASGETRLFPGPAERRAPRATGTCCGVDYPRLAEGTADVGLYVRPRVWDHAPGSLLLTEAGGYAGTPRGERYRPQSEPSLVHVARRARHQR
ncbi:MAG: inositol monophosphatase [Nocardioides sp.]|nr:inositol monophosphatase [Nocardioides sp.]